MEGLKEDIEKKSSSPEGSKITVASSSDPGSAEDGSNTLVGSDEEKQSPSNNSQSVDQSGMKAEDLIKDLGKLYQVSLTYPSSTDYKRLIRVAL